MNDRDLLELAAKASGFDSLADTYGWDEISGGIFLDDNDPREIWNPLIDDGDALRLAITLGLVIDCSRPSAGQPYQKHAIWIDELCDTATLTRRAIVMAAAAIGKAGP
jgi:hypothetical protein